MPQKEKAAIIVLAMAGVLAFGIGFWKIGYDIKKPFLLNPMTITEAKEDTWLDLQNKDTDNDGLSDYDETYLYNTSPYIEDSDSDGKSDMDEIESGTDPNCPEGTECSQKNTSISPAIEINAPIMDSEENALESAQMDFNNLSIDQVRDLLRLSGMDEATLNQIDDASLMEIYKSALEAKQ